MPKVTIVLKKKPMAEKPEAEEPEGEMCECPECGHKYMHGESEDED